jgi:hypothetical protein
MDTLFALVLLAQQSQTELDKALKDYQAQRKTDIARTQVGGATVRLIDVSLDALFNAGTSTARDPIIQQLQGGGHDPQQRGFGVTNVELSLGGAVDPYFNAQGHIIFFISPEGETEVELEETYLVSQTLPVQVKLGHYFTEFGRLNPTHPHAWKFIDQPIVNTRLFGGDGMRAPGVRGAYFLPVSWTSEVLFGLQAARGETLASFWGEPDATSAGGGSSQGGFFEDAAHEDVRNFADLAWFARWENAFDFSQEISGVLAGSALFGPNDSGPDGSTSIFGLDLVVKWRPANNERGWPFVIFEGELMFRTYEVDSDFQTGAGAPASPDDLEDRGFYAQILFGFTPGWTAGARIEKFQGDGDSFDQAGLAFVDPDFDPTRDERTRFSLLLAYHPSEFSRIRLQYNYDQAESLENLPNVDDTASSIWLSVEFLIGSHPPHKY